MRFSPKMITGISRILLGAAALATLVAALVVEENWRGNHDWRRTKAEYAARNEPLGLDAFRGPPVPDDQNLFTAPVWSKITAENTPRAEYDRAWSAAGMNKLEHLGSVMSAVPLNLADARRVLIHEGLLPKDDPRPLPEAVLAGLQVAAPLCDGLRVAVRERPLSASPTHQPLAFSDLRFGTIYSVSKLVGFRARVELAAGRPAEAFEDTYTLLRIAHACEIKPPTLLQSLVAVAMAGQVVETLKSACAMHAWSEVQLASLENELRELYLAPYFTAAFRAERAWQLALLDAMPTLSAKERGRFKWPLWLPAGWVQENKVTLCRNADLEIAAVSAFGSHEYAQRLEELEVGQKRVGDSRSPYLFVSRLVFHKASEIIGNFGLDLDSINTVRTVIALERYYLQRGHYPATLGEITPTYLGAIPLQRDGTVLGYTVTSGGTGFELRETAGRDQKPRGWTQPGRSAADH